LENEHRKGKKGAQDLRKESSTILRAQILERTCQTLIPFMDLVAPPREEIRQPSCVPRKTFCKGHTQKVRRIERGESENISKARGNIGKVPKETLRKR